MHRMDFDFSTRLLSEQQLAAKFQVSRSTIRTVLMELENEGKVSRRHGSGTYVNPQALDVEATLYPQMNLYDLIRKNGFQPAIEILSVEQKEAGEFGFKLNLFPSDPILETHSIYRADDRICMYCVDRVDLRRFADTDWYGIEQFQGSLYDYFRKTISVDIAWDIIDIRAAHAGQLPALQRLFAVPAGQVKPLVQLEIMNFDRQNQPTLLGNIFVDTDIVHLNMMRDVSRV